MKDHAPDNEWKLSLSEE